MPGKSSCARLLIGLGLCLLLLISSSCAASGNLSQFSQDGHQYDGGKWSPDGHWFAASIFPTNTIQLFSSTGQDIRTFPSGCDFSGLSLLFAWLPDGRLSCFASNEPPYLQIITLDAKGNQRSSTQIAVSIPFGLLIYSMEWNPHHFWLATVAESAPGSGISMLYLSNLEGQSLLSPLPVNGDEVSWSPDGTTLAVVQENGDIVLWKVQQHATGKLQVTKWRILRAGTPADENVAWSPSGRWLVCRHGTYQGEDYLFLLATDGSGKQVKLTSSNSDGQLDYPAWSPDGKQLIVSRVSDSVLLSLNIAQLLKDKGVKP
jgi:Tol biopolymer transport system component